MVKRFKIYQLVFSFYNKTKGTRESLAFKSRMFIFTASDFSLERKTRNYTFELVHNTRYIKLKMLILTF